MGIRRGLIMLCAFVICTLTFRRSWHTILQRKKGLLVYSNLKSPSDHIQTVESDEEDMLYSNSPAFQKKQAEQLREARNSLSDRLDSQLTLAENTSISQCVSTGIPPVNQTKSQLNRLRFSLDFLSNTSIVIDIGGNIGWDANIIINRFKPNKYIILEPIERLFIRLLGDFSKMPQVKVYNFGLAILEGIFYTASSGSHGNATSIFNGVNGEHMLRMENSFTFFQKLGLGEKECDLLILDCVGCEYDVLESLIASGMILHFRHIQFQTYTDLLYIDNPLYRYCRIRQFLSRTFFPKFLHPPAWESWARTSQWTLTFRL